MSEILSRTEQVLGRNLEEVRGVIAEAARGAGRDPSDVTLVAVTKTVGADVVDGLIRLGVRDIGENRVQPALKKAPEVKGDAVWHMIGHLQRNKVRKALGLFRAVHSVDSERLARKLDAEARERHPEPLPVFVQVNVSGETSKFGETPDDVEKLVGLCGELDGLSLRGLMTMAPYADDPEEARPVFAELRGIRDDLTRRGVAPEGLGLSMGMTGDYRVAVEEGATVVRVGTALFRGL
jgi:pyridoxal phosphate enzyme (YggS family)